MPDSSATDECFRTKQPLSKRISLLPQINPFSGTKWCYIRDEFGPVCLLVYWPPGRLPWFFQIIGLLPCGIACCLDQPIKALSVRHSSNMKLVQKAGSHTYLYTAFVLKAKLKIFCSDNSTFAILLQSRQHCIKVYQDGTLVTAHCRDCECGAFEGCFLLPSVIPATLSNVIPRDGSALSSRFRLQKTHQSVRLSLKGKKAFVIVIVISYLC